jgi:hypothetical protein
MGPGPTPVLSSRRQSTGDGGHLCCEVARSRDPSRRLISTYRYLTRLGDNHVIATQDEDREKPINDCRTIAVGGMFSF